MFGWDATKEAVEQQILESQLKQQQLFQMLGLELVCLFVFAFVFCFWFAFVFGFLLLFGFVFLFRCFVCVLLISVVFGFVFVEGCLHNPTLGQNHSSNKGASTRK